jgi:alanyl-tRNA synthetase
VEEAYPHLIAIKCHAFPGEAYVEFSAKKSQQEEQAPLLQQHIQELINHAIVQNFKTKVFAISKKEFEEHYYKLEYQIHEDKPFRVLQIGDYKPVPCGGTHLSNTTEIGRVTIKKIKIKGEILKITYQVCVDF